MGERENTMNLFKRIWYIITGKHARYCRLEKDIYEHDGYPTQPSQAIQLSKPIIVSEPRTLYLAIDFLGDTKFKSYNEQEVITWIASQWNKEIYSLASIDVVERRN